jgi:hypothetical protein
MNVLQIVRTNYQWEIRNADGYFIEGYDTYEKASNVMKQLQTYTVDYIGDCCNCSTIRHNGEMIGGTPSSAFGEYSVYSDDGNFIDTFETQRQAYNFLLDLISILEQI